jgi:large subunit ribosomal protein L24
MKQTIKKGDTVLIIAGKSKGTRGEVLRVLPADNKVVVAGANMRTRHLKPSQKNSRGGIVELPTALHRSNVQRIDPNTDSPVRSSKHIDEAK